MITNKTKALKALFSLKIIAAAVFNDMGRRWIH